MVKLVFLAGVLAVLVAHVSCQRYILPTYRPDYHRPDIILPTYRPPVRREPIFRTVRSADGDEPLWLWKGDNIERAPSTADHPFLPSYIDDIKLDPNSRYARSVDSPSARSHGDHSSSGGRRGDTGPTHPGYNRRNARDISIAGIKRPTHRDVIIPNWNPNVRTQPWQRIGGNHRGRRSVEDLD